MTERSRFWAISGEILNYGDYMKCPKCNSSSLSRRYASFWALVDSEGEDLAQNFDDHKSSTEMTDDTMCNDCGHEFEWGDNDKGEQT